jgi:NADH dehydrogenase FAD-containing subunit
VMLAGEALLADWPEGAARKAQAALGEAGVERVAARALRIENGAVIFSDQQLAPADAVIAATGLEADLPDGLDAGPEGLPVGSDLAWAGDDRIFASGDCAWMSHAPRPKLGVFGVRAAPVLIGNLILAGRGARRRKTYRPQSRWLSIMDMGDGTGLGRYGPFSWRGEAALKLKRRIDGAFTARYTGGHD